MKRNNVSNNPYCFRSLLDKNTARKAAVAFMTRSCIITGLLLCQNHALMW